MGYEQTFDGLERASAPCVAPCPACGARIGFDLWAAVDDGRPGRDLTDAEVADHGLCRAARGGIVATRVEPDGVGAFLATLECPRCGAGAEVALGLGEVQPGRWQGGVVRPG